MANRKQKRTGVGRWQGGQVSLDAGVRQELVVVKLSVIVQVHNLWTLLWTTEHTQAKSVEHSAVLITTGKQTIC